MKVTVDADRCRGHGVCVALCPEVFTLTDDGYAVTGDAAPEQAAAVDDAAHACPEQAITTE
ncbi:ferredoxin [Nocardia jiangsuensis]|uniref:Ferredoxin n=1 Tax=Nocardia jiangsuensis TaxID=1691563 RepID=A0ABV8DPM5_9NOCA